MKKIYEVYGDATMLTIIGVSQESLAHAVTVELATSRGLVSPEGEMPAFRDYLTLKHVTMSHRIPADLILPLIMSFMTANLESTFTLRIDKDLRACLEREADHEALSSFRKLEYVDGSNDIKFDRDAWLKWMDDNDVEFHRPEVAAAT